MVIVVEWFTGYVNIQLMIMIELIYKSVNNHHTVDVMIYKSVDIKLVMCVSIHKVCEPKMIYKSVDI